MNTESAINKSERTYRGWPGCVPLHLSVVVVEDEHGSRVPLNPRLDLVGHSPTGLNWGYGGSGPCQLALALCADALGDDDVALGVYQRFKDRVVAHLPYDGGWALTRDQVLEACNELVPPSN